MDNFKVISAVYGAKQGSSNVTSVLQDKLDSSANGIIKINNVNFGEPASDHKKHFGAVYEYQGKTMDRACEEGEVLDFTKSEE